MGSPGVVYTKKWVARLILDLAGYTTSANLVGGRIVEPSCGEGAFIGEIVERLCCQALDAGRFNVASLRGCLRAYDLDQSSVRKSRDVAYRCLVGHGMASADAKRLSRAWIIRKDFITSGWRKAQWIVGNPPYIRSRDIPRESRKQYGSMLSTASMGTDLYVAFFEKGLRLLDRGASLCFICSDRWLQNRYGARLREFVSRGFDLRVHIRMHEVDAFEDKVSAYPAISLITRSDSAGMTKYIECDSSFGPDDVPLMKGWIHSGKGSSRGFSATILPSLSGVRPMPLASSETVSMLIEMAEKNPTIEDAGVQIGIGIASGCDDVYITENPNLVEKDRLLPLFYMRDWRSGERSLKKWLVNPWRTDGSLVSLEDYPRLGKYFESHVGELKKRRVARDHPDQWYRTLDKPNFSILGKEMLLFPDMAASSDPVYSDGSLYPHHNCYWLISSEWDIKALGGLLMSELVKQYINSYGVKMRGSTLRFQAQYLRLIHIPRFSDVDENVRRELRRSFELGDRERANSAARRAYGLEA